MSVLQHSTVSVSYLIRGYPLKVVPRGGTLVWDHISEVQVNHHPIEGRAKRSATKHTGGDGWECSELIKGSCSWQRREDMVT